MNKLKRYVVFLVGLFVNSLGVSVITKADLGTSPISSIPYVLSLNYPLTLGTFTVIFSLLLVFLQLLILRKNFKLEHALQIPISILFGWFIDLTMAMMDGLVMEQYVVKFLFLLLGCAILGVGVYTEVAADVAMLPGESFVRAVSSTWKKEFGATKVCFDVSMTVIAGGMSLFYTHRLDGVREGTIVAALLVGFIARLIGRRAPFLKGFLEKGAAVQAQPAAAPAARTDWVISIGRQYGSGGREIGRYLADQLGCAFYDKEIITDIAGLTGYSEDYVSKREESMTNSFLYDLVSQMYGYSSHKEAPKDNIFQAQSEAILSCAAKGSCVIVGRCSDYILRDDPHCLSLFLHAPLPQRVTRVMEMEQCTQLQSKASIARTDKRRADNYRYYTRRIWGNADHYDLCIDTRLGKEYILRAVTEAIAQREALARKPAAQGTH